MFHLATCENVKPETTANYLKNYWSPSNSDAIPNIVPNSCQKSSFNGISNAYRPSN